MNATLAPRPIPAILITGAAIVVAEAVVMVALAGLPQLSPWVGVTVDAAMLLVMVSPALYFLIYRPQQQYLQELVRVKTALEAANRQLESRVDARTGELQVANGRLDETVRRLEAQNRSIKGLAEMVEVFQACHTTLEAYETISRYAGRLFPSTSGSIAVFRESRNVLETVAQWGGATARDHPFVPEDCWGLRRGRPHAVTVGHSTPSCNHLNHRGHSLCVPMMAQGSAIGVLSLVPEVDHGLDCGELAALAVPAGEQIALALANLALRESLRYQAIRDPLTGLFNRRYLEETQPRELLRARRRNLPVGIAVLDLDHFKRFNDTFGHQAGDALLAELGNLLQSSLRAEDMACRLGGEEFLLVMPETPLEVMAQRMDELREAVARLDVESRGQRLGTVTVSIGAAAFPDHGQTPEELIRSADQAMYEAKARGRNCVVLARRQAATAAVEPPHLVGDLAYCISN